MRDHLHSKLALITEMSMRNSVQAQYWQALMNDAINALAAVINLQARPLLDAHLGGEGDGGGSRGGGAGDGGGGLAASRHKNGGPT
jgi:hypothetical protein